PPFYERGKTVALGFDRLRAPGRAGQRETKPEARLRLALPGSPRRSRSVSGLRGVSSHAPRSFSGPLYWFRGRRASPSGSPFHRDRDGADLAPGPAQPRRGLPDGIPLGCAGGHQLTQRLLHALHNLAAFLVGVRLGALEDDDALPDGLSLAVVGER